MANPNLVNVTSILGRVIGQSIGTSAGLLLLNSSGSGKIYKVNSLIISNVDGTNAAEVTSYIRDNNSINLHIAKSVVVPAQATLVLISKDTSIYIEENDAIWLQASAAGDLEAVCSYEEIS